MILCADPSAQFKSYQKDIETAVLNVLRGNRYILGCEVEALEQEFANYITTRYAVGVANGTDALEIAIRALGISQGDEVITVSHTAVATVAAIEAAGATPVLVDVDPVFFTLNPAQLEEVRTPRTKAVIAVHIYGQSADLDAIQSFCKKYGVYLIEDGSQAHGARWNQKRVGSIGDVGCFSCYPTKNLGAIGDAGLITTNNPDLYSKLKMIREYGWKNRYISDLVGRNSRLDELQAAILRVKLKHLDADNERRRSLAAKYSEMIDSKDIRTPKIQKAAESVYHLYVACSLRRDQIIAHLKEENILLGIHYPVPIHQQPAYKNRIRVSSDMSVTETLAKEVMSLPMYPELRLDQLEQVVKAINKI